VYYRGVLKLKNSREMPRYSKQVCFLIILLGGILLAGQLHCCVDLTSRSLDSHVCPICSATGTAIQTPSLIVEMAPAIDRMNIAGVVVFVPLVAPRSIAPRAPPAA
jgi:hypothetical protein